MLFALVFLLVCFYCCCCRLFAWCLWVYVFFSSCIGCLVMKIINMIFFLSWRVMDIRVYTKTKWCVILEEIKKYRGGLQRKEGLGVVNYSWGERIQSCEFFSWVYGLVAMEVEYKYYRFEVLTWPHQENISWCVELLDSCFWKCSGEGVVVRAGTLTLKKWD